MASLKDIRRRISSVKNTQQITKAMKVVAASKLRRAQNAIAGARPFSQKLEDLTKRLIREIIGTEGAGDPQKLSAYLSQLHPLLKTHVTEEGAKNKVALLVVSSDRGLCGAYNTNVLRASWRKYQELKADPKNEVSVYFAGRKAQDFFVKRHVRGHWFSELWTGRFTSVKSDKIASYFTDKFLKNEIHSVEVVYTEFRSALAQVVTVKKVLPLTVAVEERASSKQEEEFVAPYIFEPNRERLLSQLLPKQVQTQFYRIFADSFASELGARMTAMDNATRNAGEMISGLTLEANRVRQASITKELMEIIGGAEALKG